MKKKTPPRFYIINWDFNTDDIVYYDIMSYIIKCWNEEKKKTRKFWNDNQTSMPETFDEFKKFILRHSQSQFWGDANYEVIVTGWPQQKNDVKIDVYDQIEHNIDSITKIFMDFIKK